MERRNQACKRSAPFGGDPRGCDVTKDEKLGT